MRCMRASDEGRMRAKRKDGKRMGLRTKCAGRGMLWGEQGSERRGRGLFGGGIWMRRYRTMCSDGQDAHTTHEHRTGELGHWSAESGRCAGARGGLGCGDVPDMGGKGGGDQYLREGLQGTPNHPDRLLVGGLLGPRREGRGARNGLSPGGVSRRQGHNSPKKGSVRGLLPPSGDRKIEGEVGLQRTRVKFLLYFTGWPPRGSVDDSERNRV